MSQSTIKFFLLSTIIFSLSGCVGPSYDEAVDLTDEAKASLEEKVEKYDQQLEAALEEFEKSKDQVAADDEDSKKEETPTDEGAIKTNDSGEGDPLVDLYIAKYRAQKNLGKINDAIDTLEEGLEALGGVSTPMWHNLAKTYENAGNCVEAESYYKELIEKANLQQYYYDIAHCYFKSVPEPVFAKIEENYLKYLKFSFEPDAEIEDYLKANKK